VILGKREVKVRTTGPRNVETKLKMPRRCGRSGRVPLSSRMWESSKCAVRTLQMLQTTVAILSKKAIPQPLHHQVLVSITTLSNTKSSSNSILLKAILRAMVNSSLNITQAAMVLGEVRTAIINSSLPPSILELKRTTLIRIFLSRVRYSILKNKHLKT
jgi:hypothetical protein